LGVANQQRLGIAYQPQPIVATTPEQLAAPAHPVEYYVHLAVDSHPRIRAAQARYSAATQRVPQARALDDPVLSNAFWPIIEHAQQTAGGRAENLLEFTQDYPWPSKRSAKEAIASREAQIAAAELRKAELEIVEGVKLAYYELWFADRAIDIMKANRAAAGELVELATARGRAGGSQSDVLRAQLNLDEIDDQLINLRRQKGVAQADLAAVIQQPELRDIEPAAIEVGEAPARLDALVAAAESCSPRLQQALSAIARDRQKQRLARLGGYPDLMLGAGWMAMTVNDALSPQADGKDNINFMVGMTLPIWRNRINAAIREANCEVVASSRELDDARNDTVRQIRRLIEEAAAADEQRKLFNERILPRARRTLQLSTADYRGQLVDFGEVVDSLAEVLLFELQAARAEATLAGAIAQIERQVGCEVIAEGQGD
jgi:outer membrane protein TolC